MLMDNVMDIVNNNVEDDIIFVNNNIKDTVNDESSPNWMKIGATLDCY